MNVGEEGMSPGGASSGLVRDGEDESDDKSENEESQEYNTWESQKKLKTN